VQGTASRLAVILNEGVIGAWHVRHRGMD
jgi:hypothetical protein